MKLIATVDMLRAKERAEDNENLAKIIGSIFGAKKK